MPKGRAGASKAGNVGGDGFFKKPPGTKYFSLKDQQSAVVRFIQRAEDIEWARQWKLPKSSSFPYGEQINCVDQFEDGTPDPGYQAGLKTTFRAYPVLIWRGAPQYQRTPDGKLVKDGNDQKIIVGYADQVSLWECSHTNYELLQEVGENYNGLMSRDFRIKRIGADKHTKYTIVPADIDGGPQDFKPEDHQLMATQRIDASLFTKAPTYEELATYLNGGTPPAQAQTFTQQVDANQTAADGEGPNPFLP